MKKESKFKIVKEADEFLRSLKSFFFLGDANKLTNEEVIMLANDIYEEIQNIKAKKQK